MLSLKDALSKYRENNNPQIEGQLIEYLKRNQYFNKISQKYGSSMIQLYLPILEYQEVRQEMPIILNHDHIVIIDGAVKQIVNANQNKVYTSGMLIQNDPNDKSRFFAITHTILLFIRKTKKQHKKLFEYINKRQKQIVSISITNEKQINQNFIIRKAIKSLRQLQFFQNMGNFDIQQLAINSKIQSLTKDTITHRNSSQCDRVGYILLGSIKLVYYAGQVQSSKKISQYFIKRENVETDAVVSRELQAGQWIGLEESFWKVPYLSSGKVISQQCSILWIKSKTFQEFVNQTTNFEKITQIKKLIEAKKMILNQSVITKDQKQRQISRSLTKRTNKTLIQKMRSLSNQPQKKSFSSKQSAINLEQLYLPPNLFHESKEMDESLYTITLPKLETKYNFFPEDFQKASIPFQMVNELKIAKMQTIKGRILHLQKKQYHLHTARNNPASILATIRQRINFNPDQSKALKKQQQSIFYRMINPQKNSLFKDRKRINRSILHGPKKSNEYQVKSQPEYKTLQIKQMHF